MHSLVNHGNLALCSPVPSARRQLDVKAEQLLMQHKVPLRQIRYQVGLMLPTELSKYAALIQGKPKFEALSLKACLKILPTVHKINLLCGVMDIKPAYQALGFQTELLADADRFYKDVKELTEGVVTVHELNRYGLLRSLLFSAMGRCQHVEGCSEVLANLEHVFALIDADFNAVDSWPGLSADIDAAWSFIQARCPEAEREGILRYLGIFRQAVSQPLLYMPLLMTRIQTKWLEAEEEVDLQTINREAIHWLEEFLASWKLQFRRFSEPIKNNKGLARAWQHLQQDGEQAIQKLNKAMLYLEEYEALAPPEQRGQLDRLNNALLKADYLEQLKNDLAEHFKLLQQACLSSAETREFQEAVAIPFHYFHVLCTYTARSIHNSAKRYQTHFAQLDRLLHPQFRLLSDITVIDLLHLQLDQYMHEEISSSEWKQIEDLGMDRMLTNLLVRIHGVFERMRHTFARRGKMRLTREEYFKDTKNLQDIADVLVEASGLLRQASHPKAIGLLRLCHNVADCLVNPLASDRWPEMFATSPFAKSKVKPSLEHEFYNGFLSVLRSEILEFKPEAVMITILGKIFGLKKEEEAFSSLLIDTNLQLMKALVLLQNHMKARPKPTPDNFEKEVYDYRDTLTAFVQELDTIFETVERPLAEYIASTPDSSDACRDLQAIMERSRRTFASHLLAPSQILVNYLHRRERQKIQKPAAAIAAPPFLTTEAPTLPSQDLCKAFKNFERYCSAFAHLCLEFTPVLRKGETAQITQHQHEHAANLLEKLPAMRELVHSLHAFGNRPFMAASLYLRMAVALEQVGKMVAAVLKVPVKEKGSNYDILKLEGRECPWADHSPHLFADLLQKDKALLTSEQKELALSLSRVIAISSRYPVSGHDKLFETVQRLLKGEGSKTEERRKLEKELQTALEACMALMKKALPEIEDSETMALPETRLETLRPLAPVDPSLKKFMEAHFFQIEERLKSIQHYRAVDRYCEIPAVSETESSLKSRQRTIQVAFNDFAINLRLAQDLFLADETPSLCLTLAEEGALRQAVLLEHVLLILSSHLPLRARPGSQNHFLWDERDLRPSRYSQNLEGFLVSLEGSLANKQPLLQATRPMANRLQPILQQLYRYQGSASGQAQAYLERFKALSSLRDALVNQQLTPIQQRFLEKEGIGLERLDAYIRQCLILDLKLPALQLLQVVDQWLELYEKQLYK